MQTITLTELNSLVRNVLESELEGRFWVKAELSEVRTAHNGHCYIELVEKDERGHGLIAKARANIWRNVWQLLEVAFERETGRTFSAGLNVLVLVSVHFHELYGYSLTVYDIDPTYTLGDLAQRRKEILQQLENEGVLTLNKELEFPLLPKRVAIISSANAAGYGDFCNQLNHNSYGFNFYTQLFTAVMQGEQVESSIIAALNMIAHEREKWDVVVIIRGGGATSDLVGFDTYTLAANCAQFPLPIITGIGHERDDTVIDFVAHTRVKTPTAAAELLINLFQEASALCTNLIERLSQSINHQITQEKENISRNLIKLPTLANLVIMDENHRIQNKMSEILRKASQLLQERLHRNEWLWKQTQQAVYVMIERKNSHLQLLQQRVETVDPQHILNLGYSLTLKDGKIVTDVLQLQDGDEIVTQLAQGRIKSIVKQ